MVMTVYDVRENTCTVHMQLWTRAGRRLSLCVSLCEAKLCQSSVHHARTSVWHSLVDVTSPPCCVCRYNWPSDWTSQSQHRGSVQSQSTELPSSCSHWRRTDRPTDIARCRPLSAISCLLITRPSL